MHFIHKHSSGITFHEANHWKRCRFFLVTGCTRTAADTLLSIKVTGSDVKSSNNCWTDTYITLVCISIYNPYRIISLLIECQSRSWGTLFHWQQNYAFWQTWTTQAKSKKCCAQLLLSSVCRVSWCQRRIPSLFSVSWTGLKQKKRLVNTFSETENNRVWLNFLSRTRQFWVTTTWVFMPK